MICLCFIWDVNLQYKRIIGVLHYKIVLYVEVAYVVLLFVIVNSEKEIYVVQDFYNL